MLPREQRGGRPDTRVTLATTITIQLNTGLHPNIIYIRGIECEKKVNLLVNSNGLFLCSTDCHDMVVKWTLFIRSE